MQILLPFSRILESLVWLPDQSLCLASATHPSPLGASSGGGGKTYNSVTSSRTMSTDIVSKRRGEDGDGLGVHTDVVIEAEESAAELCAEVSRRAQI